MSDNSCTADFSIAIIGGGSASEALMRQLAGSDARIVVFEPDLVGGECPFVACMPSKSMLHDRTRRSWSDAVERRDEIVSHLDDSSHAEQARDLGATLVRAAAEIIGPHTVRANGTDHVVEHIVIATGATPTFPDIDGLDRHHDRVWTSRDVLTADAQPDSVVVLGGGVIGSELAFMFAGFGTRATTLDTSERPADEFHPKVGELMGATLEAAGVKVVNGIEPERIELTDRAATVHLADGSTHRADRLVVAVGRKPNRSGLGLEALGLDPDQLAVDDTGLVQGTSNLWIIGDAAGKEQYTHAANHHAAVVADHLVGPSSRSFDDVVIPACIFVDPPVITVGPTWADLHGDADVVWAEIDLDTPRSSTDEHGDGFLAVAARRSSRCIVAANGTGARFDEIVHALTIAIDGAVPVDRLAQTIQPFPTVGEVLGQAFDELLEQLGTEA